MARPAAGTPAGPPEGPVELSIVVSTKDRPTLLRRCLESLGESDDEVIVVDQSTRSSPTEALPIAARVIRQAVPSLALARNHGALRARGSVVAFLDDDVVVTPGWRRGLRAALASGPRPVAVFGAIAPLPGPGLPVCEHDHPGARRFHPFSMPWEVGSGGNMAVDRATLLHLGGFPTDLTPSAEDTALIVALLRGGHEVVFEPDMRVLHPRLDEGRRLATRRPYGLGMGRLVRRTLAQGDLFGVAIGTATVASQVRQITSRERQMRREGRTYLRVFGRGLVRRRVP